MKIPTVLLVVVVGAVAGTGGWYAARQQHASSAGASARASASPAARRILYYQSAMHPWIKSDRPGRCTICGMELAPVYEGEKGYEAKEGIVTLGSNIIQVIHVENAQVKRRALLRTMRFAGTVDDDDTRHRFVSAYVDGRIDGLAINYVGAEVVAGQPLATFYSPMLLAAEREYVALHQEGHPGASAVLQDEHLRLIDSSAQRLQRLGLSPAQIAALNGKNLHENHSEILAPMSGTVVARNVYEGQYVKEGDKLFEIADFSTMWFVFDAYERDLSWLKPGQTVAVTTPAAPGRTFTGTLTFIDPNLKEATRSAKVRVELPNPVIKTNGTARRELFHKLYAEASVNVEVPETLVVPRSAVLAPGAHAVVYVDKGAGAYEQRAVVLGRAGDTDVEVLEGLSDGELVVSQGNMLIDAQAQLNASARSQPGIPEVVPAAALTEAQRKLLQDVLAEASGLSGALAADKLEDFNLEVGRLHNALGAALSGLDRAGRWWPLLQRLEVRAHVGAPADLVGARKQFFPISEASVELVKALRTQEASFKSVKVFRCPMTADAFPGAPAAGEWIQLQPPLRNPFFGGEMPECGSEVK